MKIENLLGSKEHVAAVLKALGIKEGDKLKPPESFFSPMEIIEVCADDGTGRTQDEWIEHFSENGKIMLSMPDLYNAGKSNNLDLLSTLQGNFCGSSEVTSTRIIYQPKGLQGKIIHYFGSTVVEPVETELVIPYYGKGIRLSNVLKDKEGLEFMQAILGTKDEKEAIIETLEKISDRAVKDIRVWTSTQKMRKSQPEKALLCGYFGIEDDGFGINCDDCPDNDTGYSSVVSF